MAAGHVGRKDHSLSRGTVGWGDSVAPVDPTFVTQACDWMKHPSRTLLGFVWEAHEQMLVDQPAIDGRDLERSITQLIEPRIRDAMSGYEPFYSKRCAQPTAVHGIRLPTSLAG
jgi:hypothetical protein